MRSGHALTISGMFELCLKGWPGGCPVEKGMCGMVLEKFLNFNFKLRSVTLPRVILRSGIISAIK